MNLTENQLRSWQPRRPSARLDHRIFAEPPRASGRVVRSFRCLAPAAACLLLAMAAFNRGGGISSAPYRHEFGVGMIGSNQIAYLPDNYQQEQNSYSPATFEWTNLSGSTSSISPFRHVR